MKYTQLKPLKHIYTYTQLKQLKKTLKEIIKKN